MAGSYTANVTWACILGHYISGNDFIIGVLMQVYILWEWRKGGSRIIGVFDDQIKANARLISLCDFPDPIDADYTVEEWTIEE